MTAPLLVAITDRVDTRHIVIGVCLVGGIAGLGFAVFAQGLWSAMIRRLLTGIVIAGSYMPGLKALTGRLPEGPIGGRRGLHPRRDARPGLRGTIDGRQLRHLDGTIQHTPPERRGAAIATQIFLAAFVALVSPIAVGAVLDGLSSGATAWTVAFLVMGLGPALGAVMLWPRRA